MTSLWDYELRGTLQLPDLKAAIAVHERASGGLRLCATPAPSWQARHTRSVGASVRHTGIRDTATRGDTMDA
jgi:hypothetical protein